MRWERHYLLVVFGRQKTRGDRNTRCGWLCGLAREGRSTQVEGARLRGLCRQRLSKARGCSEICTRLIYIIAAFGKSLQNLPLVILPCGGESVRRAFFFLRFVSHVCRMWWVVPVVETAQKSVGVVVFKGEMGAEVGRGGGVTRRLAGEGDACCLAGRSRVVARETQTHGLDVRVILRGVPYRFFFLSFSSALSCHIIWHGAQRRRLCVHPVQFLVGLRLRAAAVASFCPPKRSNLLGEVALTHRESSTVGDIR